METSERHEKFAEPLGFIKDSSVRDFAKRAIELLPDYFFEIGASSTGKYHPAYTIGEEGLLRHTLAAVRFAVELCKLEMWKVDQNPIERDLIIAALIVHDGWKSGRAENKDKFSVHDHPNLAVQVLSEDEVLMSTTSPENIETIFGCIRTHMGQWNTAGYSKVVLDKPTKRLHMIAHQSDYLASRKEVIMDFNIPVSLSAS